MTGSRRDPNVYTICSLSLDWRDGTTEPLSLVFFIMSLSFLGLIWIKNVFLIFYNWRQYAENLQSYVEVVMMLVCTLFLILNYTVAVKEWEFFQFLPKDINSQSYHT